MAARVEAKLGCSGRAACRYLGFNRSTLRYQPKPIPEKKRLLEMEIVRISKKHPTLGYKKMARLLRDEGWHVNKKLVQRVRREEGLQVPPRKPRRRRQGLSTGLPVAGTTQEPCLGPGLGLLWSCRLPESVVSDYTQRGGKLRAFNLIDEYTRECHCIHTD